MSPDVGSGLGLYPYGEVASAENDEVSSTYEGRHLTVLGTEISSHMAGHTLQQAGHPMVVGENIVGVAFTTETATGRTRYVTFDTEGIWLLSVVATDPGNIAVVAGDELFIHKTNGIISKNFNKNTHAHFGYALGGVTSGNTAIISVKVHWCPDNATESVGTEAVELVSAVVSETFREYFYEATGGSYINARKLHLVIPSTAARTYTATVAEYKLTIPGDAWIVTGNAAVIEAFLSVEGVSSANMRTQSVLQLGFLNQNITSINNYSSAYISLRDDTVDELFGMARLLVFHDVAALPDGGGAGRHQVLTDAATAQPASDVRIRCGYGPTSVDFWIMATTTVPD